MGLFIFTLGQHCCEIWEWKTSENIFFKRKGESGIRFRILMIIIFSLNQKHLHRHAYAIFFYYHNYIYTLVCAVFMTLVWVWNSSLKRWHLYFLISKYQKHNNSQYLVNKVQSWNKKQHLGSDENHSSNPQPTTVVRKPCKHQSRFQYSFPTTEQLPFCVMLIFIFRVSLKV